jgi:hypothetical protein
MTSPVVSAPAVNLPQDLIVYGPNLPRELSKLGTFVVHSKDCADLKKAVYRYVERTEGSRMMKAADIPDLVDAIYPARDFEYDPEVDSEYQGYRDDIHVFPCVHLSE